MSCVWTTGATWLRWLTQTYLFTHVFCCSRQAWRSVQALFYICQYFIQILHWAKLYYKGMHHFSRGLLKTCCLLWELCVWCLQSITERQKLWSRAGSTEVSISKLNLLCLANSAGLISKTPPNEVMKCSSLCQYFRTQLVYPLQLSVSHDAYSVQVSTATCTVWKYHVNKFCLPGIWLQVVINHETAWYN